MAWRHTLYKSEALLAVCILCLFYSVYIHSSSIDIVDTPSMLYTFQPNNRSIAEAVGRQHHQNDTLVRKWQTVYRLSIYIIHYTLGFGTVRKDNG